MSSSNDMPEKGFFLSFEGSEGCGKSTQLGLLRERLESAGREVLLTREPGGTFIGERVRELLQYTPEAGDMCDEAELLLFTASRAQLVRAELIPALAAGAVVIADRFFDSTTVYQGIARGLDRQAVDAINGFAVGSCRPQLTLLLDLDAEVGRRRAAGREGVEDRMEQQPAEFYQRVREGYLELAATEPERICVIDAAATVDEVAAEIWSIVRERIGR
ncbi:MAG: dTMP kinase [Verrucomicrobiales bacterium]